MEAELLQAPLLGLGDDADADLSDWNLPLAFMKKRHCEKIEGSKSLAQSWRMKDRVRAPARAARGPGCPGVGAAGSDDGKLLAWRRSFLRRPDLRGRLRTPPIASAQCSVPPEGPQVDLCGPEWQRWGERGREGGGGQRRRVGGAGWGSRSPGPRPTLSAPLPVPLCPCSGRRRGCLSPDMKAFALAPRAWVGGLWVWAGLSSPSVGCSRAVQSCC